MPFFYKETESVMQDYVCLMRKLLENGILTEKDSFALVNAEEAEHISLPFFTVR